MEAATSALQQPLGLNHRGLNPPHGAQLTGTRQSAPGPPGPPRPPGPSGGARPEEQQHHKPFFYIQPSQPYVPVQGLQWPVPLPIPVSYSPYYSYAGLGYSLPMMPQYQPSPYMEPPGFVVPHSHLHLMDYRRLLNPQYYQTMAYHSRRFRYQHSPPRVTSSQVQTEPLSSAQRTSTPGSNDTGVSSGISVCNGDSTLVPSSQLLTTPAAVQNRSPSLELKDPVPSSPPKTSSNGSFVIQTEEVRIECCTTPVGLQLLHSHETAEVSHRFSQDMVHCSSVLQGGVLQDNQRRPPAEQMETTLQVCPDILLVGGHSSGEEMGAPQESSTQMNPPSTEESRVGPEVAADSEPVEKKREMDQSTSSENFHSKVIRLPFDPKYLEELQKIESTVWSMEEPLKSSSESLTRHDCFDSKGEQLAPVIESPSTDVLMVKESPTEEAVSLAEVPSGPEDGVKDMLLPFEGPVDASEAETSPVMEVSEKDQMTTLMQTSEVDLMEDSPVKAGGVKDLLDHQDTSFESLPTYLPSTSWLTDFDAAYYCSKMPPTPKKQNKPVSNYGLDVPNRRRKLDPEFREQQAQRKPKERYKPKGKVDRRSLSDHECCLRRNFSENAFVSYQSKRERLCSRCLSKQRICSSVSPGVECGAMKRKAVPLKQWNDVLAPTCEACKLHTKKVMKKGSNPDVWPPHRGQDTEGESSETGSCRRAPQWRSSEGPRRISDFKRSLTSKKNLDKFPAVVYPKLKERNCTCTEQQQHHHQQQQQHQTMTWDRQHLCPHGKTIREMDENCALPVSLQQHWRNGDQFYPSHRCHNGSHSTEKSWKAAMPNLDLEVNVSKNEARSLHMIKHKKSQSHGTHRKDTRY